MRLRRLIITLLVVIPVCGCTRYRDDLDYNHPVEFSWQEPDMVGEFSLFQGVTWDSAISQSMRPIIANHSLVKNRSVLDLFCGPGVIALTCGHENSKSVLSLAESPIAAACANYNLAAHDQESIVKVQNIDWLASPIVPTSDRFDVILANLSSSEVASGNDTIERRISILLDCVGGNLESSGQVFVVCENEAVAKSLQAATEQAGNSLLRIDPDSSLRPVFEIKTSGKVPIVQST